MIVERETTGMKTLDGREIYYGDRVQLPRYKTSYPVIKPDVGYNSGNPTVDVGDDAYPLEDYISWGAVVV